jgi:hypothetical protein
VRVAYGDKRHAAARSGSRRPVSPAPSFQRSIVVNRWSHASHSRRRRTPFATGRLSITRDRDEPQFGQVMGSGCQM